MKLIREFDDFGWAKSNLVNPWILGYTGIDFDVEPTRENLNELIEMALSLKMLNANKWGKDIRENDIDNLMEYFHSGGSYLGIDFDHELGYGSRKGHYGWDNIKWIEYSKLIDNGLNENKKDDDFEWVRNITPIVDGDDMYARSTKGDSFTIRVKEEYRNKGCSDIYLIHGTSQSSIENVVFVDATNGIDVNDGNCNTARDGRALLLKFIEGDGHGHEGFLDVRSGSENDEIEDFCEGNCWWVHPQVIEVVSDNLNENKKDDDFGWAREIPLTFDENHQPSVGDVLVCFPGYNAEPEDGFGESNDPNCAGRGYAEGRIIVVGSVDVWDNNPEGKRLIVWPDEDKSTMYWDYDDICFECGIYGFALTYYTDTLTESDEDNGLDWIINTDPNVPIPFGSIEEHTTYRAEPTEVLLQAIEACNGDTYMYNNIETAYVIEIIYDMRYDHIFCDSDRTDDVIGLRLQFYGDDGSLSGSFWVTDDMVNLYEHYGKLTENTEDEWAWAKDIEPGIELETNTLYYFEPKLTVDEIEFFGNNISNAPKFKEWLLDIPNRNSSVRTDGGITYLITKPDLPIRIQGWCTETSVDYAQSIYPGVKVVDARQTFNF